MRPSTLWRGVPRWEERFFDHITVNRFTLGNPALEDLQELTGKVITRIDRFARGGLRLRRLLTLVSVCMLLVLGLMAAPARADDSPLICRSHNLGITFYIYNNEATIVFNGVNL